jgi:hypothetical protein
LAEHKGTHIQGFFGSLRTDRNAQHHSHLSFCAHSVQNLFASIPGSKVSTLNIPAEISQSQRRDLVLEREASSNAVQQSQGIDNQEYLQLTTTADNSTTSYLSSRRILSSQTDHPTHPTAHRPSTTRPPCALTPTRGTTATTTTTSGEPDPHQTTQSHTTVTDPSPGPTASRSATTASSQATPTTPGV